MIRRTSVNACMLQTHEAFTSARTSKSLATEACWRICIDLQRGCTLCLKPLFASQVSSCLSPSGPHLSLDIAKLDDAASTENVVLAKCLLSLLGDVDDVVEQSKKFIEFRLGLHH